MIRNRPPAPMSGRVDASEPITPALLAAVSGQPLDAAESYLAAWFGAIRSLCDQGRVLVFDEMVIGRPDPLLLEAAHTIRAVRRAEASGLFDDEEDRWYDEYPDGDVPYESPSITDRALAILRSGWQGDRVVDGLAAGHVALGLGNEPEIWVRRLRLASAARRVVLELADAIHVGGAGVVDARLTGERIDSLRWAA